MIDKTSLQIIEMLRHDGRISNALLAEKIGVSTSTVTKKINTMIDQGVIVIKAMPNPDLFGYLSQALIGLTVDLKAKDHICRVLANDSHVNMVTTCFGRFDILLIVFFHNLNETYDFIKFRLSKLNGIDDIETYFVLENKSWLEGAPKKHNENAIPPALDELDHRIIKELTVDGRAGYSALASKLGTSKPTISRRISFLSQNRFIKILAIPNPAKLHFTANAYMLLKAEETMLADIRDRLISHLEIHLIMRLVNRYELLLGVYATDLNALHRFMKNHVWNIEGITKSETLICGDFFQFNGDVVIPH